MNTPQLVATCWTTSGTTRPLDASEVSPHSAFERIDAVARGGWVGLGFAHEDLELIQRTTGFAAVADYARSHGLTHVEVELATDWWLEEAAWRPKWSMLLEAAEAFGAPVIKAGTAFSSPWSDLSGLVQPLRQLAIEAADRGTRVALEPLPFSMVGSVPAAADLVRQIDHAAAGLAVDFWHVFRAGTSLEELAKSITVEQIFQVELNDADAEPIGDLFEDTRDRRRYCGEGVQDVPGFIRTLSDLGFNGPWGVEILSDEHRRNGLVRGLERAKSTTLASFQTASTR
ncbi:sugar phosphate isomerase/epimerase family protein [Kineococcus sp. SYSU DK003]|uniref:sugar phosphate isomerase/epimerase family protein n=1 Tax=Kineococcus sp. SYSU DK003 TaxID=3383124 RepID=UPI003D7DFA54